MSSHKNLTDKINTGRLSQRLWELVEIPSPTGREREIAFKFDEMLSQAGASTEIDETNHESPSVIGRLKGQRPGRTIQLAGHLDHIDIPHPTPQKNKTKISGRGSADMKNGLAGILEIISVLNESGCDFAGEVLITAYGLHEAPKGDSSGIIGLLKRDIKGGAAIVCEGPEDAAVIAANGMAIWDVTITHKESPCHELCTKANKMELLETAAALVNAMAGKDAQLKAGSSQYSDLLSPESLFIGQLHYGDFYNRLNNKCFLQGTRRWHPDKKGETVRDEFEKMLGNVQHSENITITNTWQLVGDAYEFSQGQSIVQSLRKAYELVNGWIMPVKGHSSVTDACRFVHYGGIPAVLLGFGTAKGHADFEYVEVNQMVHSAKVLLLTVLDYLGNLD